MFNSSSIGLGSTNSIFLPNNLLIIETGLVMTQTNGVYINKIKSISFDNLNPTNSGFINASDRAVCLIRLAAMIIMTIVIMLFVGSFIMRSICIENSMVTMTSILVEAAEIALKIS